MNENNNTTNSELNGFDSASKGYTVTPQGGFFEDASKESAPAPEPVHETSEPTAEEIPVVDVPETEQNPVITPEPKPKEEYRFDPNAFNFFDDSSENNNTGKTEKPKKGKKYGVGILVASILIAAIIGASACAGTLYLARDYIKKDSTLNLSTSSSGLGSTTTINVDKSVDSVIQAVAEKAGPSVVGIRTTAAVSNFFGGSSESKGEGSGIIYTSDGYIITNHHVIESVIGQTSSSAKIEVFLDNDTATSYPATLVGYNISYDLAVIKIDKTGLTAIEIGDSDNLSVGQFVAAIGCPGGLDFMGSVSYGIISGLNRTIRASTQEAVSLIQTDAAINPGNSGGALLNTQGQLIGVNSSKIAATAYEGMGFAIPVKDVVEICKQIIEKKDDPTPYVGITLSETYDEATLNKLGYPSGAVVSSVVSAGPAYESGIRRGDIITEFNGTAIKNYNDLNTAISNCKAGDTVTVKLYRSGRYYSTSISVTSNNAR